MLNKIKYEIFGQDVWRIAFFFTVGETPAVYSPERDDDFTVV